MADESTTTPADGTQATETKATEQATPTTGDATGTNSGSNGRTFTQAEVENMVKERLERDRETRRKETEKAEAQRQQKQLEEQGEYKKIADTLQAKLDAAEKAARDTELKLLRRDAAVQVNLPAPLADRLQGETLDEMVADAKSILAALPKPAAPNVNGVNGDGSVPRGAALDEQKKRSLADRFGVKPGYIT